jgi:hypothetical protein
LLIFSFPWLNGKKLWLHGNLFLQENENFRKIIFGATAAGIRGQQLEEQVSSMLVKDYKLGDQPNNTIKRL